MRKLIQFLALGLLLIVAPAGAWYYLNLGYNERKSALDQLQDYGQFDMASTPDYRGHLINEDSLRQRFSIVGFTDKIAAETPFFEHTQDLYKQFGQDGGIALLTYTTNSDSASIAAYLEANIEDDSGHWYIMNVSPERFAALKAKTFADSLKNGNHFAFVDTTLRIRNYYDATDRARVGELAKHIAMFVAPTKSRPDLVFKRKQEK